MCVVLFFFSSRRRHTRWPRDWSSDVCSSDLNGYIIEEQNDFTVTDKGEKYFHDFEINLDSLRKERRHFTRKCLDWSERRYHLAGSLGNAVLMRLLDLHWIEKLPDRAVKVTKEGGKAFESLGINVEQL